MIFLTFFSPWRKESLLFSVEEWALLFPAYQLGFQYRSLKFLLCFCLCSCFLWMWGLVYYMDTEWQTEGKTVWFYFIMLLVFMAFCTDASEIFYLLILLLSLHGYGSYLCLDGKILAVAVLRDVHSVGKSFFGVCSGCFAAERTQVCVHTHTHTECGQKLFWGV